MELGIRHGYAPAGKAQTFPYARALGEQVLSNVRRIVGQSLRLLEEQAG